MKVEQKYRIGRPSKSFTAINTFRWDFGRGWASPLTHPISVTETVNAQQIPGKSAMGQNYPNPFNPETWIPYQLASAADVTVTIYAADETVVRTLLLGHQPAGVYKSRARAAYWDGKNAHGELVASGVYFYTLTAGDFTATRKMLIRK